MEHFKLKLTSANAGMPAQTALCGVVSSGNLEVLLEVGTTSASCEIEVNTSAQGFRAIWEAVLGDFVSRYPLGQTQISINDAGATPAVVSLRLAQAFETSRSQHR